MRNEAIARAAHRDAAAGARGSDAAHLKLSVTSDALTERSRRIWSSGEYDRIAAGFRHEAESFVARRGLRPGLEVLDAASGSGNLTIPAARTGAAVTGIDLVGNLVVAAAQWASRVGVSITLDTGNVEELPYDDAQFDVVMSMFGVMFASRPDRVVAELARVTKPGGQVALANWTRSGFIGRMLALHVAVVPPPAEIPSPLLWADEDVLRERFDPRLWDLTTKRQTLTFRYPHSPAGTAELFRAAYGPTVRTFDALDVDGRASFAADLADHWMWHQRGPDRSTEVDSEYLEVVAVRR
jgi:2-polyprenyl-3-methyl-5-hydroxy-6-metoxy-1,4-benzoquinol methylase